MTKLSLLTSKLIRYITVTGGELFTCLAIGSKTNVMYMFIYYVRMYVYVLYMQS